MGGEGLGAQFLTGNNTYTGATSVGANGSLYLDQTGSIAASSGVDVGGAFDISYTTAGASIKALTGSGAVRLGAQTLTLTDDAGAFDGTISGNGGSLTKAGAGNLTLNGAGSWTGATTISGGTLTGTTATIAGSAITDNAALVYDQASDATVSQAISGTGAFTKAGLGNLTLASAGSWAGTTTISGGTLTGTSASIGGSAIINNAALVYDQASDGAASQAISGAGSFTKAGIGNLTLGGVGSWTGTTTISGGTLTGTSASIAGSAITNNAALVYDQAADATAGQAISGAGSVTKTGAGVLTLASAGSYSGPTSITAGAIKAGGANVLSAQSAYAVGAAGALDLNGLDQTVASISGAGTITLGAATLTTGNGANSTFAGAINGAGGLIKTGAGALILSGTSGYTGATTVNQGILAVDGAIASNVTVNASGGLIGSGTVGAVTLVGGGISAGDSLGTLTVAGALSFDSASAYVAQVDLGAADLIHVQNTATLNGALDAIAIGTGYVVGDRITLLTADQGLSGAFSQFDYSGFGGIRPQISYDASNVYLTFKSSVIDTSQTSFTAQDPAALDPSQIEFDGGTLQTGGYDFTQTVQLDAGGGKVDTSASQGAFTGVVTGQGGLTVGGGGTLMLTQANTFSGGLTVNDGSTVAVNTDSSLGDSSGALILDDGSVSFQDSSSSTRDLTVLSGGGTVDVNTNTVTWNGDVTGPGDLTKTGEGALDVTNANPGFTGDVYFEGTLQAGATDALGSGTIHVLGSVLSLGAGVTLANPIDLQDGVTVTQASGAATLSGNIGQSGGVFGLTKAGAGTLTLSGANTYTGPTIVGAGTLVLAGGAAISDASDVAVLGGANLTVAASETIGSLSGAGTVNLGSNGLNTGGDGASTLFSGQLIGSGALTKAGEGLFYVTSANPGFTGDTYFQGTLEAGASGAFGSGTMHVLGTVLALDNGVTLANPIDLRDGVTVLQAGGGATLSGNIGQTGGVYGLTKIGGGALVLSGTNSFTGPTVVAAGTLSLTGGAAISDASDVTVLGGATLNLASAETIGSLSGSGSVTLGATLTTGADGASTAFTGQLGGTGGLTVTGPGTFTLAGADTSTGATLVSGGNLALLGSIAGPAQVTAGTLSGTGATGALTLQGGTVAPGAAPGAFGRLMATSFTGSGGTLAIGFGGRSTGAASDQLLVIGAATLSGARLDAQPVSSLSDYGFEQTYLVMPAGSVTGRFTNPEAFTANSYAAGLYQRLRYDLTGGVVLEVRKLIDFSAGAADANARAAGQGLNAGELLGDDHWTSALSGLAALSPAQLPAALDLLSGEGATNASSASLDGLERFMDLVQSRPGQTVAGENEDAPSTLALAMLDAKLGQDGTPLKTMAGAVGLSGLGAGAAPAPQRQGVWAAGFGGRSNLQGQGGAADVRLDDAGIAAGMDLPVSEHGAVGFAIGAANINSHTDARLTHSNGNAYYASGYARYDAPGWFAGVAGAYGRTSVDIQRTTALAQSVKGDTDANAAGVSAVLGGRIAVGNGELQPMLTGAWGSNRQQAYAESGTYGLDIAASRTQRFTGTLGVRWNERFTVKGASLTPELRLAQAFNSGDRGGTLNAAFTGAPAGVGGFTVAGAALPPTWTVVGAGVTLADPANRLSVKLAYQGAYAPRLTDHQLALGLRLAW